ncbi:cupin-like domain-containing protein [Sphingobium sp. HBC34]|uniref:Cupin-like domain-containing protein n=1 Tax=Sphingobium cyanobacteriorum TaxID=3063954 RepID=A0ABT8ZKU9_9SPHN|nr:cupin-like domain-containing protein [Sphingobium sp. HBC34]MDO7834743.1 cupin-like domain-containing protein [Sphingobium sp. HBC34]
MTAHSPIAPADGATFPDSARAAFAAAYPDESARLNHGLAGHGLLTLDALAGLAERMPAQSVEYNLGKLPLGVRPEDTPSNGLTLGETIRTIETNGSWAVLKNVERDPAYAALLDAALAELEPIVGQKTGPMLHREAFIFLSSPGSVTPFHMDPEHNILLQIMGTKTMTVFPARDEHLVPAQKSEDFHGGGHRNLVWQDGFKTQGKAVRLAPGDAIHVPVKAPHFVENGPTVSVSLSVTWRSERSVAEGELHSFNALLRKRGLPVATVSAQPERQGLRRLVYRVIRKLGA